MSPRLSSTVSTGSVYSGSSLADLPKSNVFTMNLPSDPDFPSPEVSYKAPRDDLGPRTVKGALYTYVRPERAKKAELLAVSNTAMRDIGLRTGEEETTEFQDLVAGSKIFWDEMTGEGIYPWAQCYGGWQFGSWAGQLGDGRAISLFESTNPTTATRYELQLKGAGKTPYSRFADGRAVLRSSIREFIVSEGWIPWCAVIGHSMLTTIKALNGLGIPTTRALSLTLLHDVKVRRERIEPGAVVLRFAQSWLRVGTFDILRARGDRNLVRHLSDYVAENVFAGWESLPATVNTSAPSAHIAHQVELGVGKDEIQGPSGLEENRYLRLYRAIVRRNALTVAAWQAYAFTNGVLNTDNTSLLGLSLDFGPFAFLDNFDPDYTPNHDDHMLRYSYKNQPSIIWWNLVRLGESMGELIGAGDNVDNEVFVTKGVSEAYAPELIKRAENLIQNAGEEFKTVFLAEYDRLMRARLGLKNARDTDRDEIFSELLDILEGLELDFNHFFRRLSFVRLHELETEEQRGVKSGIFFHKEGVPVTAALSEEVGRERLSEWLRAWAERVKQDSSTSLMTEDERQVKMLKVNPRFIPRSWILDEVIKKVEFAGERQVLERIMRMAEKPFEEHWTDESDIVARTEEDRWCGDVPRQQRGMQCSCSS